MSSEIKTLIVFDTNILFINNGKGKSYDSFEFNSEFDTINDFIKLNNLSDKVILAVPSLVIEELKNIKLWLYLNDSKKIENSFRPFLKLPDALLKIPKKNPDYEEIFDELVDKYIKSTKVELIDCPPNDCFKDIVFRAINKKKPFIVTKNHSDYGFKDVVIWESILNYDVINDYDKVILMTGDKDGFDNSCVDEFQSKFDKYFYIFESSDEALNELSKDYGIILEDNEYLKFANETYFKEALKLDISNKKIIYIEEEEFAISRYDIVKQCVSLEEETDDSNEKTGLYLIKSLINVYYEHKGSENKFKVNVTTYIDEAKDIQEIEYEPELL